MTHAEIEAKVMLALTSVAPEVDATTIRPELPVRDQVDLDSMDFLRFVVELHKVLGVEVPEADYARLDTPLADGDEVAFLPPVSGG